MNTEMAYLIGMILGNGEIQQNTQFTTFIIDIPHKSLYTDDCADAAVYVKASLVDIRSIIEPLVGHGIKVDSGKRSTKMSFTAANEEYLTRELLRLIGSGRHHSTMSIHPELFKLPVDQKKCLLRGIADVTGYIRKSNMAFGQTGAHRVYLEIPTNWNMVIDLANMLKDLDVPVQTLDFGHPNFRDSNLKKYNEGKKNYWKKEHQLKVFANEFVPIGFKVIHKQKALQKYSQELLTHIKASTTHKFYWEKTSRKTNSKPSHPGENDESLPYKIRGKHYDSWQDLARDLGYGK